MIRIEELERLLGETRTLYEDAQDKIAKEQKRKEKIEKLAKKEIEKSKKVLRQTSLHAIKE